MHVLSFALKGATSASHSVSPAASVGHKVEAVAVQGEAKAYLPWCTTGSQTYGKRSEDSEKPQIDNLPYTYIHVHVYVYIYIYIYFVCVCACV